jgi:hypothetical protein
MWQRSTVKNMPLITARRMGHTRDLKRRSDLDFESGCWPRKRRLRKSDTGGQSGRDDRARARYPTPSLASLLQAFWRSSPHSDGRVILPHFK